MHQSRSLLLLIVATLFVSVAFQGCNTIRGVGKDVEQGGKKIQRATD